MSSHFVVVFMEPRFGRSSTFSTAEYCFIHLFTNALYFFMYLGAASRDIFGPFGGVQSNAASNRNAYAALIAKYVVLTQRSNVNCDFLSKAFWAKSLSTSSRWIFLSTGSNAKVWSDTLLSNTLYVKISSFSDCSHYFNKCVLIFNRSHDQITGHE
jgi:hypothetical protein